MVDGRFTISFHPNCFKCHSFIFINMFSHFAKDRTDILGGAIFSYRPTYLLLKTTSDSF